MFSHGEVQTAQMGSFIDAQYAEARFLLTSPEKHTATNCEEALSLSEILTHQLR